MVNTEHKTAFTKLVATRNRMIEIRKKIAESYAITREALIAGDFTVVNPRRDELHAEWESAFHEFETATNEFSESVNKSKK